MKLKTDETVHKGFLNKGRKRLISTDSYVSFVSLFALFLCDTAVYKELQRSLNHSQESLAGRFFVTFDPFLSNGSDVIAGNVRSMVPGELATDASLPSQPSPLLPQVRGHFYARGRARDYALPAHTSFRSNRSWERPCACNDHHCNRALQGTD